MGTPTAQSHLLSRPPSLSEGLSNPSLHGFLCQFESLILNWESYCQFLGTQNDNACMVRIALSNSAIPKNAARQAPLSMGFPRQEYWSGLPFPTPGGSSQPRNRTLISCVSCIGRQILYHWAAWEAQNDNTHHKYLSSFSFYKCWPWGLERSG